jgi:hypothetical protein
VIAISAAGRPTVTGSGLRSAGRKTSKATRVTLKVLLTNAATASLHSHRDRLKVKLEASFTATGGARSSATSTLTFA